MKKINMKVLRSVKFKLLVEGFVFLWNLAQSQLLLSKSRWMLGSAFLIAFLMLMNFSAGTVRRILSMSACIKSSLWTIYILRLRQRKR